MGATPLRLILLVCALASAPALAQMLNEQGPPKFRLVHKNTFAIRLNPLGLLYDGRFSFRYRLYESESRALRDNFVGVGVAPTFSPAFMRVGPYVEFNPVSVFGLWAAVQFVQYFGSFDLLQSYPGPYSNFSDSAIKANRDQRQVTNGWELTLGASFQVKVSSLVLRSQARLVNGNLALRPGDTVYYDQFYDVAAPNRGWFFTNDLDALWQMFEARFSAGARYTATVPFSQGTDNSMHRVGPFLGYTFKSVDGAAFNNPTVFLLVQWWLKHRFRTGADTRAALPLMGVGFQITGDFLSIR